MRVKSHSLIFIGMGVGVALGFLLDKGSLGIWLCDLFGSTIFIGALKMIVAPLIFFSILTGITSLPSEGELWDIGWRTMVFYFITTSIAAGIGLVLVLTIQPGMRSGRAEIRDSWDRRSKEIAVQYEKKEQRIEEAKDRTPGDTIRDNLKSVIQNPFQALSTANSLGIIFFAILLGIALILCKEQAAPVLPVIRAVNAAIMKLTGWIMYAAPFFIMCLVASLVATHGAKVFQTLSWYVITVLGGIAIHMGVLMFIVKSFGKLSPLTFLKGIRRAWAVAFATRSSAATLPVTMECVEEELKVPRKVSRFVLPLGATINMDGTALYEGVAVLFLIQLFSGMEGVPTDITMVMTVVIFLTAVLASVGAAAVPDAGLITMLLVANAVGLDAKYIPLVFAVDAFLDMFRTSTNVTGDSVGSVVIARYAKPGEEPAPAGS